MKHSLMGMVFAGLLAFASLASARGMQDIEDGKLLIQPERDVHFSVEGNIMAKAQLFGYVSDLKDREKFDGIVLEEGGDDAQRSAIQSIARTLELKAYERKDSELSLMGE